MKIRILVFAFTWLFLGHHAFAKYSGFIELSKNHVIYYEKTPAQGERQGRILVFNGLIYKMKYWENYRELMSSQGYEIIQYGYSPHPESIAGLQGEAYYNEVLVRWGLPTEQGTTLKILANEAEQVLRKLEIEGPVDVVGLSYGSFVAGEFARLNPHRVNQFIMFAPAIRPSHFYDGIVQTSGFDDYFLMGQQNSVIDYQYRVWLRTAVQTVMTQSYWSQGSSYLPSGLDFEDFFTSVYHLARAVRYTDFKNLILELPKHIEFTMVTAGKDEKTLLNDQQKAWEVAEKQGFNKTRLIHIADAAHAIPGAHPKAGANITRTVLQNKIIDKFTTMTLPEATALTSMSCGRVFSLSL